jgi:hypothetical protein
MKNPYVDEVDKKRKREFEVKTKNFDKKLESTSLKKSYSDENMFETFTKDLMKKVDDP